MLVSACPTISSIAANSINRRKVGDDTNLMFADDNQCTSAASMHLTSSGSVMNQGCYEHGYGRIDYQPLITKRLEQLFCHLKISDFYVEVEGFTGQWVIEIDNHGLFPDLLNPHWNGAPIRRFCH